MSRITLHLRVLPLALVLFGAIPGFAENEKKKVTPPPPPPQPVPQKIKVLRGNPVEIPLKIYGRKNQPISYLIRRAPVGKLSAPKNTELEVAVVKYEPPADRAITKDSFEYASKSSLGVSAPSTVEIEVVDIPPDLISPVEVTFGPVLIGMTDKQTIEIMNNGGTATEGDLFVESPWRIEISNHYRIEPGQRRDVAITFAPDQPGEFKTDLRFSSQPDRVTTLKGLAQSPIEAKPPALTLERVPGALLRAGALQIINHTAEAQTVAMAASDRLLADPPMTLNPEQSGTLMIRTKEGDSRPIAVDITLEAGAYRTVVPVHADALPGIAQAEVTQVELRVLPPNPDPVGTFQVRNYGGQPARAELRSDAEFVLSTASLELPVGGEARVEVRLASGINPPMDGSVELKSGGATQRIAIFAKGNSPQAARTTHPPRKNTSSSSDSGRAVPQPVASVPDDNWSPYEQDPTKPIDPVQLIRTVALSATACTVEWHGDRSAAKSFIAEIRELSIADKELVQRWRRFPSFRAERTPDNKVRGTFDQLQPGRLYTARVRELDDQGEPGSVVLSTSFNTQLPANARRTSRWKYGLIATIAAVGIFFFWRQRRSLAAPAFDPKKTQRMV